MTNIDLNTLSVDYLALALVVDIRSGNSDLIDADMVIDPANERHVMSVTNYITDTLDYGSVGNGVALKYIPAHLTRLVKMDDEMFDAVLSRVVELLANAFIHTHSHTHSFTEEHQMTNIDLDNLTDDTAAPIIRDALLDVLARLTAFVQGQGEITGDDSGDDFESMVDEMTMYGRAYNVNNDISPAHLIRSMMTDHLIEDMDQCVHDVIYGDNPGPSNIEIPEWDECRFRD